MFGPNANNKATSSLQEATISNDFFNDYPTLGLVFDFNLDRSLNPGEADAVYATKNDARIERS